MSDDYSWTEYVVHSFDEASKRHARHGCATIATARRHVYALLAQGKCAWLTTERGQDNIPF